MTGKRSCLRRGTAVVSAADSVGALAAIRSLGRRGVRVVALDSSVDALGLRSRFAEPRLCPDPGSDEEAFVDFLAELSEEFGEAVPLFAISDRHLDTIARNYARLEGRFLHPFVDGHNLLRLRDKRVQAVAAVAAGLSVPRTVTEPSADLIFPVVVKASDSARFVNAFGVKGFRCDSRRELDEVFERTRSHSPIVQE